MTRPDLQDLLERVEGAEGPDREIDCLLACALDGFFPVPEQWADGWRGNRMTWRVNFCCWKDGVLMSPGHGGDQMVRRYSASLDAALALVERALPGANCVGFDKTPHEVSGYVSRNCVADGHWVKEGYAKTPALAILAALIKAKLSDTTP